MHNFNYYESNCMEVTIMLSCCQSPPADMLRDLWYRNKDSLISFIEAAHWGVKGIVRGEKDTPVADAVIVINGDYDHVVKTTTDGEYWRLLLPGHYNMSIRSDL